MTEPLMTVPEVAALFQVQPGTIVDWCAKDAIPYIRLNPRALRFRREDIDAEFVRLITDAARAVGVPVADRRPA